MRSSRRLLVVLVATSLVALGCGNDDGANVRTLDDGAGSSASASASASASSSSSAPAAASIDALADGSSDGGYEYASDVRAHRLVVVDVCEVIELLDADPIDFPAVATLYRDGKNSLNADGSIRSLGGFAAADDRLHGLDDYYGTAAPLDDFVTAALDGTGPFAGAPDSVRAQGVEKAIQNQVMLAWVRHELQTALDKADAGELDIADGAVHNWDEAWAYYHGAQPACAPYATADKRAADFATSGADGATARANEDVLAAMIAGRDALIAGDVAAARGAAEAIERAVFVTYSQAAIRYATLAESDVESGDTEAALEHRAEGLAFWRVIEAGAAANGADVDTVNAVFDLSAADGARGGGDEVRAALEPAWTALAITDEDIGSLQ